MPTARAAGRLSLFDCVAIGVNGIVGSGIFLLPGRLAAEAGPASIAAFPLCGALCALIALCFCEAAGMFDRSGGPYVYARAAFGEPVGFAVGWIALASGTLGMSAVARGFAQSLSVFAPGLSEPAAQGAAAAALLLALGALNAAGLRAGAGASNLFSIAKLLPLVAFAAIGAVAVRPERLAPSEPIALSGLATAVFTAVFAVSGFEVIPVPAGETRDSRRTVPIALVVSLTVATLLYAAVQAVAVGVDPGLAGSATPLSDAARLFMGRGGETLIAAAAVVSTAGYCAGSALVVPRYSVALAEDRLLPSALAARHPRTATPLIAIAVSMTSGALLAALLDFGRLVDIANVSLFCQYVPTCLAVLILRRTRPDLPRRWRLPGGVAIPAAATAVALALFVIARPARREIATAGLYLAVGAVVYIVALRRRRLRADAGAGAA